MHIATYTNKIFLVVRLAQEIIEEKFCSLNFYEKNKTTEPLKLCRIYMYFMTLRDIVLLKYRCHGFQYRFKRKN